MSNRECRVFHPRVGGGGGGGGGGRGGGDLPQLAMPNIHVFYAFFFLNRETHFGRCPMLSRPPSNTKHSVDLYHAFTPMSCPSA